MQIFVLHAQALSPVGRCKSFDASGDGYGRGEGCAVAILKHATPGQSPAALAVLRATATNQDGRSSVLTAPNGPSQSALIILALRSAGAPWLRCLDGTVSWRVLVYHPELDAIGVQAGLDPGEMGSVMVHGTGTPLGDPIEIGALGQAISNR